MSQEDREGGDEASQRDALVVQPLVVGFDIVDEYDVVVVLALVVDLGLGALSSSHFGRLAQLW